MALEGRATGGAGTCLARRTAPAATASRRAGAAGVPVSAMSAMNAALRRLVTTRAGGRCEYCGLGQEDQEATFHVDHVVPTAAGGLTIAENLALACVSCSVRRTTTSTAVRMEP